VKKCNADSDFSSFRYCSSPGTLLDFARFPKTRVTTVAGGNRKMRHRQARTIPFLLAGWILFGALAIGCGGGAGDAATEVAPPPPAGPVSVLAWDPPASYMDNVTLDPYRDLDHYEVYVRQDPDFSSDDLPVALIAAVVDAPGAAGNPATKVLETEFVLENLEPFIPAGNRYYVSLKSVGIDGQKSDFMSPVTWNKI